MIVKFTNKVSEYRFELIKRLIVNETEEAKGLVSDTPSGEFVEAHIKSYWPSVLYLLFWIRHKRDHDGKIVRATASWLERELGFDKTKEYVRSSFYDALNTSYYDGTKDFLDSIGLRDFVLFNRDTICLNPMIVVHKMEIY